MEIMRWEKEKPRVQNATFWINKKDYTPLYSSSHPTRRTTSNDGVYIIYSAKDKLKWKRISGVFIGGNKR